MLMSGQEITKLVGACFNLNLREERVRQHDNLFRLAREVAGLTRTGEIKEGMIYLASIQKRIIVGWKTPRRNQVPPITLGI
jgi:hypothetical protein